MKYVMMAVIFSVAADEIELLIGYCQACVTAAVIESLAQFFTIGDEQACRLQLHLYTS